MRISRENAGSGLTGRVWLRQNGLVSWDPRRGEEVETCTEFRLWHMGCRGWLGEQHAREQSDFSHSLSIDAGGRARSIE